jgi:hypothetical protein
MASVLVAYGYTPAKAKKWHRWLDRIGPAAFPSVVVDNAPSAGVMVGDRGIRIIHGSNSQFEFSGYREGLQALDAKAPVVLVNDSLFSHHATKAWAQLVRNALAEPQHGNPGVVGDPRTEPIRIDGQPLRHLASWLFVLRTNGDRAQFTSALDHALTHFDQAPTWPGYAEFLAHYYAPTRRWGGYTQALSPDDLERKKRCSWAEHRLSLHLQRQGQMRPLSGLSYQAAHVVDRALSALKRLKSK